MEVEWYSENSWSSERKRPGHPRHDFRGVCPWSASHLSQSSLPRTWSMQCMADVFDFGKGVGFVETLPLGVIHRTTQNKNKTWTDVVPEFVQSLQNSVVVRVVFLFFVPCGFFFYLLQDSALPLQDR